MTPRYATTTIDAPESAFANDERLADALNNELPHGFTRNDKRYGAPMGYHTVATWEVPPRAHPYINDDGDATEYITITAATTTEGPTRYAVVWDDNTIDDWNATVGAIFRTLSRREAARLVKTFADAIMSATEEHEDAFRASVVEAFDNAYLFTIDDYTRKHRVALTEYREHSLKLVAARIKFMQKGIEMWEAELERRQQLLNDLKTELDSPGLHRETLPQTTDRTQALCEQFINDDLLFHELEQELETAWENTDPVPFDSYLETA